MPAWGTRVPEQQIWKLVAYIDSMQTGRTRRAPGIDHAPADRSSLSSCVACCRARRAGARWLRRATELPVRRRPAARELAWLGWVTLITFCVVTVLVWILLMVVIMRRRGSFDEHAPVETQPRTGIDWISSAASSFPA